MEKKLKKLDKKAVTKADKTSESDLKKAIDKTTEAINEIVEDIKNPYERKREMPITQVLSTGSTLLDLAICGGRIRGGGIPGGMIVEIYGPSGSGKTAILTELAGSAQRNGGEARFDDPEARLEFCCCSFRKRYHQDGFHRIPISHKPAIKRGDGICFPRPGTGFDQGGFLKVYVKRIQRLHHVIFRFSSNGLYTVKAFWTKPEASNASTLSKGSLFSTQRDTYLFSFSPF